MDPVALPSQKDLWSVSPEIQFRARPNSSDGWAYRMKVRQMCVMCTACDDAIFFAMQRVWTASISICIVEYVDVT